MLRQRGLEPARRSRWWRARAGSRGALSSTSVSRAPSISAECCGAALAEDALDAGRQARTACADVRVRGERPGDVLEVARRQRRARRDAVGRGIVPAQPQQLVGQRLVAAAPRSSAASRLIGTQVRQ